MNKFSLLLFKKIFLYIQTYEALLKKKYIFEIEKIKNIFFDKESFSLTIRISDYDSGHVLFRKHMPYNYKTRISNIHIFLKRAKIFRC